MNNWIEVQPNLFSCWNHFKNTATFTRREVMNFETINKKYVDSWRLARWMYFTCIFKTNIFTIYRVLWVTEWLLECFLRPINFDKALTHLHFQLQENCSCPSYLITIRLPAQPKLSHKPWGLLRGIELKVWIREKQQATHECKTSWKTTFLVVKTL